MPGALLNGYTSRECDGEACDEAGAHQFLEMTSLNSFEFSSASWDGVGFIVARLTTGDTYGAVIVTY